MSTVNKAMLKDCLIDSALAEIYEIEALDYSYVQVSDGFKERVKEIITSKEEPKRRVHPKKVAIILIASVLLSLSIMFSVSAKIREAVADFFVKIYDTFAQFIIVENDEKDTDTVNQDTPSPSITYPTIIETEYKPSYIEQNNYELLDKVTDKNRVFTVWTNGNEMIDLIQSNTEGSDITLDTENATYQSTYIGEKEVFYFLKNGIYTVAWIDYGYLFNMTCDESLGWDEVEKIVTSLEPITD
ncbi:MAG: DUF4367 domain-containing protein [Clostridia bacterium]|nr:DUF4367 domain-containing protein [Clostridia bacterium]